MKIRFLGTAAAEGVPALFCTCAHCQYARRVGGREKRTRSGALIDGVLKLDFGPDSLKHMLDNDLDYTYLRSLLITHSHEDHLSVSDLSYRRDGFAMLSADVPPLTVYGNAAVGQKLAPWISARLHFEQLRVFETRQIDGYAVTPLEAEHFLCGANRHSHPIVTAQGKTVYRAEEPFIYLIEKDGEGLIYGHDTDEFTPANMEFLQNRRVDLISLDCTDASWTTDWRGHMNIEKNLRMRERLLANGTADARTRFVAHHFSHNGLVPYEEMERLLPGFIVSYDGLEVSVRA